MARKSPLGIVAFRFKVWLQGRISRRWVGRTQPVALPCGPQGCRLGGLDVVVAAHCGLRAEEAVNEGSGVAQLIADAEEPRLPPGAKAVTPAENFVTSITPPSSSSLQSSTASASDEDAGTSEPVQEGIWATIKLEQDDEEGDDFSFSLTLPETMRAASDASRRAEVLGREVLRAVLERQWGIAWVLLRELRFASELQRLAAIGKADQTGRSILRLCVDGQLQEAPGVIQALERGTLTVIMGTRRPYWWLLHFAAVCHRSGTFIGETRVGMPRPRSRTVAAASRMARVLSSQTTCPAWEEVRWSEPEACQGRLELIEDGFGQQFAIVRMEMAELKLTLVSPGEAVDFGSPGLKNPLSVPLVVAGGKVVGSAARGVFDPPACARLAAVMGSSGARQACGPRETAALAVACGANSRKLADDGLSPYTAALLGQDPCGLLVGLHPALRARIRHGDALAWAEAGRAAAGEGHADLVAAPLSRGLAVPEELAQRLLEHCFENNLPLLASRVLARVNGERYLLAAAERAEDPQWYRVTERILRQPQGREAPVWCTRDTLSYILAQIRQGRYQFRLLLRAFLDRIHAVQPDFYAEPAALAGSGMECPICFEPLCRATPVAFTQGGHVVCPHFLCDSCARGYAATAMSSGAPLRCPECRRGAAKVDPLPDLSEDPLQWFDFLAGPWRSMPRSTLLRAISAMLPLDADAFGTALDNGQVPGGPLLAQVGAAVFLTNGLYAWIWRHDCEHRRFSASSAPEPLSALHSDKAAWFRFWNLSQNDAMTRGEVLRAVMRSTEASSMDKTRVDELRQTIGRMWDRSVDERRNRYGHCASTTISCAEFMEEGGLGDLLKEAFVPEAWGKPPEHSSSESVSEQSLRHGEDSPEIPGGSPDGRGGTGISHDNGNEQQAQLQRSNTSNSSDSVAAPAPQQAPRSMPTAAARTQAFNMRYACEQPQEEHTPRQPPILPLPSRRHPADGDGPSSEQAATPAGGGLPPHVIQELLELSPQQPPIANDDYEDFPPVPREDVALVVNGGATTCIFQRGGALAVAPGSRTCFSGSRSGGTRPSSSSGAEAQPSSSAARPPAELETESPRRRIAPHLAPPPCATLGADADAEDEAMSPSQFLVDSDNNLATNVPHSGGVVLYAPSDSSVQRRDRGEADLASSSSSDHSYIVSL